MEKLKIFWVMIVLSIPFSVRSQINYGSNNGNYLIIRGTKLYYEEYGNGTPLILLHGGFGSIADFKKCIPELSEKYRVIIPDAPGLGRSEHADSTMAYCLMATYYSKMIDLLKLDSAYVIGWSDGGIAALLLGRNRPDKIKKVISTGPNYRADGMTINDKSFCENKLLNIEWVEANLKDWIDNYLMLSPQDEWKRYIAETKRMWLEREYFPKSYLEAMQIPVLIVYGDRDMFTLEHEIELYRALKNGELCILPNTSHDIFLERPELINRIAIDFFENK